MPIIRIEYFHDLDPDNPRAYETFTYRMSMLQHEYAAWQTVVLDSLTFAELTARKRHEKILNPMQKFAKGTDTRQWFSGVTDDLEEMVIMRFAGLPMNVVTIAHIDERRNEISGEILRGPFAPGRLSKRGQLVSVNQETYHSFAYRDEKGRQYALQTANDGQWAASSQIDVPDPVYPAYDSLFVNAPEMRLKPIHVLIYGDTGTGKSTFAATFRAAGNVLVWCFDAHGKDLPYHKGAKKVGELQTYEIGGQHGSVPITYRDVEF